MTEKVYLDQFTLFLFLLLRLSNAYVVRGVRLCLLCDLENNNAVKLYQKIAFSSNNVGQNRRPAQKSEVI